jgi:hypothetical protein
VGVGTIFASILAAASENISLVGSAGFTAFALTGFTLMWRSWRRELNRLAFYNEKKERQKIALLNALIDNGVQIPQEYRELERADSIEELDL